MALTNAFLNKMIDFLNTDTLYMSLHTADPTTTGANEVSGSPYQRQQISFGAPASGQVTNSNNPEFSVPNNTTVTHIGLWTAQTGGTFYISEDPTDRVLLTGDVYRLNSWTVSVSGS